MIYFGTMFGTWILLLSIITMVHGLYIPRSLPSYRLSTVGQYFQQVLSKTSPNDLARVKTQSEFEDWLSWQKDVSFSGILNNIGGISQTLPEDLVAKGAVIASPSDVRPNYFYQWTRDAALTIKSLVLYLDDNNFSDENIANIVEDYIENNYYIQRLNNKSGRFDDPDLSGLGEPKFLANNKAFNENWGRPQRDGPGLRVITILTYLNLLERFDKQLSNEFLKSPQFVYNEIVKPDLTYITKNWQKEGFDLWEEVNSIHLFTSLTQLRALKDGIVAAEKYENDSDFVEELQKTFKRLKTFIENDSGFRKDGVLHLLETPSLLKDAKRSGLDAAILLASIHSHNYDYGDYSDIPFDVNDSHMLNTLSAMVADMRYRYPLNHNKIGNRGVGVALGRYPEDIYDGYGTSEGNPWFIATASAAEVVYKFVYKLKNGKQDLIIDSVSQDFFKQFLELDVVNDQSKITIPYNSLQFNKLIDDLFHYSDSFLEIVKDHVDRDGHMSEQFNKYNGFMQGAVQLTWSHSAVWNAFRWRERTFKELSNRDN